MDGKRPVVSFAGDRDRRASAVPQDAPGPLRAGDRAPRRRVGGGPHLPRPRPLPQAGRRRPARAGVRRGLRGHGGGPHLHPDRRRGDGPHQLRRRADGDGGPDVHGHPGPGPLRLTRAEGAVSRAGDPRRGGDLHRGHRAGRRQRRRRHPHPGRARRRRVGHQRRQALHHERHAGRLALPAGPHLRRPRVPRHVVDRRPHRARRRGRLAQAGEARHVVERHRRAVVHRRAGPRLQHHR